MSFSLKIRSSSKPIRFQHGGSIRFQHGGFTCIRSFSLLRQDLSLEDGFDDDIVSKNFSSYSIPSSNPANWKGKFHLKEIKVDSQENFWSQLEKNRADVMRRQNKRAMEESEKKLMIGGKGKKGSSDFKDFNNLGKGKHAGQDLNTVALLGGNAETSERQARAILLESTKGEKTTTTSNSADSLFGEMSEFAAPSSRNFTTPNKEGEVFEIDTENNDQHNPNKSEEKNVFELSSLMPYLGPNDRTENFCSISTMNTSIVDQEDNRGIGGSVLASVSPNKMKKFQSNPTSLTRTSNDLITEELGMAQLKEESLGMISMRPEHIAIQDDLMKSGTSEEILRVINVVLANNNTTTIGGNNNNTTTIGGNNNNTIGKSNDNTTIGEPNTTAGNNKAIKLLDPINLATAIYRIAKLTNPIKRHTLYKNENFQELITIVGKNLENYSTQGIANIFWGLVRLQLNPDWLPELLKRAESVVENLEPKQLSSILFCLGKMPGLHAIPEAENLRIQTTEAIGQRLQLCHSSNPEASRGVFFNEPLELVCIATGLSRLKTKDWNSLNKLAELTILKIEEFDWNQLASLAWSFSNLTFRHEKFYQILKKKIEQRIEFCTPKVLVQLTWALAKAEEAEEELFKYTLAPAIRSYILDFETKDLCTILWSFCHSRIKDDAFLKDIGVALIPRVKQMNCHDISAVVLSLSNVAAGGLSNSSSSSSSLYYDKKSFFKKLSEHSVRLAPTFSPLQLTKLIHGFGVCELDSKRTFCILLEQAEMKKHLFMASNIVDILTGLSETNYYPPEHIKWLLKLAISKVEKITPEDSISLLKVLSMIKKSMIPIQKKSTPIIQKKQEGKLEETIIQQGHDDDIDIDELKELSKKLIDVCLENLRTKIRGHWKESAVDVANLLEATKKLEVGLDPVLLETIFRYFPSAILSEDCTIEQFLRVLGQMANITDIETKTNLRQHIHRRRKVQEALELKLEVLREMNVDQKSGVALIHTLAILGCTDFPYFRTLLELVENKVMTVESFQNGGEKRNVDNSENYSIEDSVNPLFSSTIQKKSIYKTPTTTKDDDDDLVLNFEKLYFDDWCFLAYSLCEANWRLDWCKKILDRCVRERYFNTSNNNNLSNNDGTTIKNNIMINNNNNQILNLENDESSFENDDVSEEALWKLAWSYVVMNYNCPSSILLELARKNQDKFPDDFLLNFAQPVAFDFAQRNTDIWVEGYSRKKEDPFLQKKNYTRRNHTKINDTRINDTKINDTRRNDTRINDSTNKNESTNKILSSFLSEIASLFRIEIYGKLRRGRKERQRQSIRSKEYAYDTWLSDTLIQLQIPHQRAIVLDNLYRVPIAFPKYKTCIDVAGFIDLTCPDRRMNGSVILRRRQLMEAGWIVIEIPLVTLHTNMRNGTFRSYISQLVRNINSTHISAHKYIPQDEITKEIYKEIYQN